MRRREWVRSGLVASGALWLPGCGPGASKSADPTFESTVRALMEEEDDAFVPLMKALRAGMSAETLCAVAINASARLVTAETDADMHTNSPMRAAHLLGARLSPQTSLVPLFWAWDFLVSFRPDGTPLAAPDPSTWPAPETAAQAFDDAVAALDPAAADAAIGALYASEGATGVVAPLVRHSLRPFEWLGHRAIWTAFALRGLRDFGWDAAPWLLRSIAHSLAGGVADPNGYAAHDASMTRVGDVPLGWRGGTDDASRVPSLLATFRTGDSAACVDAVIAALQEGVSPRTVWTALALAGVEVGVRWQESSFGVHQVDAVNALRNLQTIAGNDEQTAALCMLQGAAWCPLFRGYVEGNSPVHAEGIDAFAPAAGTPSLDDVFANIGDMDEASAMLLNWLEAGGDPAALVSEWSEVVSARFQPGGNDVHRIKYHAALLEEADAVLPEWRHRVFLGIPLRSPSTSTPLWARYDEAVSLIASL